MRRRRAPCRRSCVYSPRDAWFWGVQRPFRGGPARQRYMQLGGPTAHPIGKSQTILVLKQTLAAIFLPTVLCAAGHSLSVVTLNLAKESSVPRMAAELRRTP